METEQLVDLKRAFSSPLPLSKSCCSAGGAISHNLHIWQHWLIWIFQESVALSFKIFWHSLLFITPGYYCFILKKKMIKRFQIITENTKPDRGQV